MTERRVVRTGGFEDVAGYARAVRSGPFVAVSATIAADGQGRALHAGDVHAQTHESFTRALAALAELGGSVGDVIRTRIYLVPGADWRACVLAHRELFGEVTPANSTVVVAELIPEGALVEVELDAFLLDSA